MAVKPATKQMIYKTGGYTRTLQLNSHYPYW